MSAVLDNVPVALLSPLHGQIVIANFCCCAVNSAKQTITGNIAKSGRYKCICLHRNHIRVKTTRTVREYAK